MNNTEQLEPDPVLRYREWLANRAQNNSSNGFEPTYLPGWLFDYQTALVDWSVRAGRSAIFADCGLGKTAIELAWAQNVVQHTNKPVLILTPLAVAQQTVSEGQKFGIEARRTQQVTDAAVYVTNYERLHHYNANDFAGVVCDESGILKNFDGVTKAAVTEFMRQHRYRLLCTATPSPNDFIELGTSSEALGYLGHIDMLNRFFRNTQNTSDTSHGGGRHHHGGPKWRFKGHAQDPFWKWVCSWARAVRKPSDLGFSDEQFVLPRLIEREHIVKSIKPREGFLFALPARGLAEVKEERRRTLKERCEKAADLVSGTGQPAVCWTSLNDEADLIEKLVKDSVQVSGADSDEEKEEKFASFQSGHTRVLVIKPVIGAWGLNWQHCNHMTAFAGYSFEQYYQGVRRFLRFGQTRDVIVDNIVSDGEVEVIAARKAKAAKADAMFEALVRHMNEGLKINITAYGNKEVKAPSWL